MKRKLKCVDKSIALNRDGYQVVCSEIIIKCPECGKELTDEDAYGHDCEVI